MNRSSQEVEDMYLDWFNNFLSTERFREYYGLSMAEAENTHVPESADVPVGDAPAEALRRILDHRNITITCDLADPINFGTLAEQMDRNDGFRFFRDQVCNLFCIDVERIGADIDEHRRGTAQHEGVGGGDEGVRGHDDLITRLQFGQ